MSQRSRGGSRGSTDVQNPSPQAGEQFRGPLIDKHILYSGWFERAAGLVRLCLVHHEDVHGLSLELNESSQMKRKIKEFFSCYLNVCHTCTLNYKGACMANCS